MSKPRSLSVNEVVKFLRQLRINVSVKSGFKDQVDQVDALLSNDKTGLVTPTLDFMIKSATVPMKIETHNDNLNSLLTDWQTKILNKNINIDVPRGLKNLSVQYFKERLRSSMIGLKVRWEDVDFGANGKFKLPTKMWIVDGQSIKVDGNNSLNSKKYTIFNGEKDIPLINKPNESIYIRKPYTSWYEDYPTPYLVRRGSLFNALLKNALVQKQSDLIEGIVPYLFNIKAGNDAITQYLPELLPDEKEFDDIKEKLINSKERWTQTKELKDMISTLRYDVNMEHLIPDLTKFLNDSIVKPIDKNLLYSLGYIELEGFSTRQESMLNPKVLIEEIKDSVVDWACLLYEVMLDMLERNKEDHRNIVNNDVNVIPGTIKAFITEEIRETFRSLYDRGLISRQNIVEDMTDLQFEAQVDRIVREKQRGLEKDLYPPITINQEQHQDDLDNDNLEDQNKLPGTPEAENFNNARKHKDKEKKKKEVKAPFETIDELPENVKNVLPIPAQIIWLRVFNESLESGDSEETAIQKAWGVVKKSYKKVNNKKKWVKK